jgi:hypothetical protein
VITLFVLVPLLLLLMFGLLIGRTACWILIGLFILFCATHQAHADTADDFANAARHISTYCQADYPDDSAKELDCEHTNWNSYLKSRNHHAPTRYQHH